MKKKKEHKNLAEQKENIVRILEARKELERRKIDSKLLFYQPCCKIHSKRDEKGQVYMTCPTKPCPDSKYWKFHMSPARVRVDLGSNRCIDGDTLIYDPVIEKNRKVKDIKEDFYVLSWDGQRLVPARAHKPFVKGNDDIYEVTLSNGSKLNCTMNHQVLTKHGYLSISDLSVGSNLLSPERSSFYLPQTILDNGRLIHGADGPSFWKIVLGSLFGYLSYFRFCGERLPFFQDFVQDVFPSPTCVREYNGRFFSPFSLHSDVEDNRQESTHFYRQSDRLSNLYGPDRSVVRPSGILSGIFYRLWLSVVLSSRIVFRSILEFFPLLSKFVSDQLANRSGSTTPSITSYSDVISILKKKKDVYYDFEVPFFHNYYAGGFINHNSGKSILGLTEILNMACFEQNPLTKELNPTSGRYRIYCPDFSLIEKNLLPNLKSWIPWESLSGIGKSKQESWENSYDPKYHLLYLKRDVIIDLMSYDQDLSKSESVELDGVWMDEECPEDIFTAAEARCLARQGKIWITVTPLYGFTWGMKFLETVDSNVEVLTFHIYDNPFLNEDAVREFDESLRDRPQEREARIYGKFMEFSDLYYAELKRDIHRIENTYIDPSWPVIFALDPHPRKASMMAWAYINNKNDVVFFDELEMKGTAEQIAEEIRKKEAHHISRTELRVIDPAARAQGNNLSFDTDTLREFEKEGLSFSLADNSEAGYNVVHEYLSYDASKPLGPFNRPSCYFTKDVPKLWYSMTHLMWDNWRHGGNLRDKREKIKDFQKDGADVVRYILASRPTFRSFVAQRSPVPMGNYSRNPRPESPSEVRRTILAQV